MMALFLDILILGLLLLFLLLGYRRGFILTLCSLVAVIVALIGGNFLADTLSPKVADAIQPRLESVIQEALEDQAEELGLTWESLSENQVITALKDRGGLWRWAAETLEEELSTKDMIHLAPTVAARAAASVAGQVAHALLFFIGFLLVLIAWSILSHALDLVARLPGLDGLNRSLGAVIGLVKGLIIVWIGVWFLCSLTGFISQELAGQTRILLYLSQHGPLDLLTLAARPS